MKLTIQNNGNEIVALLEGRLDTAASQQFATEMQPLIDNADKTIILDCSDLAFISSSGLRLFLSLRKATIAKKGEVIIKGMNNDVKQVFSLTGFLNIFKVV